jgi:3-dehydroquinate dehydratase-1
MPLQKRVKEHAVKLVGVVMTPADLRLAGQVSPPPDLFELRLDCLSSVKGFEQQARALPAPLIITARHPLEGGKNNLSPVSRRELLLQFLPIAKYVDVELRSAGSHRAVLDGANRSGVSTIISFHDLEHTPQLGSLRAKAKRAAKLGARIFKVATRIDSPTQLARMIEFVSTAPPTLSISAMGIGKLGPVSRLALAQCGSRLIYTSLGRPRVEGQLGLNQFRSALRHLKYE